MSQAADDARTIAHTDLTHVDSYMEIGGELAHELAKVDALFCLEIEDCLITFEKILDEHRMHILIGLERDLFERTECLGALLLELAHLIHIFRRCQTHDLFERGFQILDQIVAHFENIRCCDAVFKPATRVHDDIVTSTYI